MHGLNLIANCSSRKKWQMTLVRQNNDRMYVAVWSAKCIGLVTKEMLGRKSMISGWDMLSVLHDSWWNCSCLASVIFWLKTVVITGVRSLAEIEPACSLPSSHKLLFLTTGLETVSPDSLCDIPQYLLCHDHSPTCTLAYTSSSSPVQGLWTLINRTQAVVRRQIEKFQGWFFCSDSMTLQALQFFFSK
jgi:hypothetical protein